MDDGRTLRRLRSFLFGLAAVLFAGTAAELVLAEHYDGLLQLLPFAVCGLGLALVALVWARPSRPSVLALRAVMIVAVGGSLLGAYLHFDGNLAFDRETHPDASTVSLYRDALIGGNPLLAPGALAAAAAVAIAATYATAARPAPARASVALPDRRNKIPA